MFCAIRTCRNYSVGYNVKVWCKTNISGESALAWHSNFSEFALIWHAYRLVLVSETLFHINFVMYSVSSRPTNLRLLLKSWCNCFKSNCVNNKMLECDWFLTVHIYSLILLCNSKTVRLLEACNRTGQIGQLKNQ